MKKHQIKSFIGYGTTGIYRLLKNKRSIKNIPYTTKIHRSQKPKSLHEIETRVFFMKTKYNQLLKEDIDPVHYDYEPEWKLFWKYSELGLEYRTRNVRCRREVTCAYTNSLN